MPLIVPELPSQKFKKRPLWFKLLRYASDYLLFALARLINRYRRQNDKLKVLIIKTDGLGDFILFSPALRAYRHLYPSAHIVLIVRKATFPLAELCPYVNEVWEYDPALYESIVHRHWYWFRRLSGAKFDIAIDAIYSCNDYLTTCLAAWSGAPVRYGFDNRPGKTVYARRPFINRLLSTDNNILFETFRNAELVRYAGYNGEIAQQVNLWTNESDEASARYLLESLSVTAYAVVAPGAQDLWKRWGTERFAEAIVSAKNGMGLDWLVCGSAGESELCEDLTLRLRHYGIKAHNVSGKISLRQLTCIMTGSHLCLTNDSMAAHLAAACKIPAVCVRGGGHYGRFYPYPDNPMTIAVSHSLPCYNCDWICSQPKVKCIENVSESDVVKALVDLFEKYCNLDIHNKQVNRNDL